MMTVSLLTMLDLLNTKLPIVPTLSIPNSSLKANIIRMTSIFLRILMS
jgi:hypothetical protein